MKAPAIGLSIRPVREKESCGKGAALTRWTPSGRTAREYVPNESGPLVNTFRTRAAALVITLDPTFVIALGVGDTPISVPRGRMVAQPVDNDLRRAGTFAREVDPVANNLLDARSFPNTVRVAETRLDQ